MAFLAPLFLAGLAAVALPVLLHLRRNRPKETVAFSSLMFLEASPPVTKRRSRLQDILLLILRCLALALLILAFARPYLPEDGKPSIASDGSVMNLILIDTSASMRGDPLKQALLTAERLVDGFSGNDWISVAAFSDRFRPLLGADRAREVPAIERKAAAKAVISMVTADWNSTKPDAALQAAVASTDRGVPARIHLIGDFQKGGSFDRLRGEAWPDRVQIVPHSVARTGAWTNAGVNPLPLENKAPRVRVSNSEGSVKSDFTLKWSGTAEPVNVSVAPGASGVFEAPADSSNGGRVVLAGDDFTFDNEAVWTAPVRPVAGIWYPDETAATDTNEGLYFLTRALQSTPDYQVEITGTFAGKGPAIAVSGGIPGEKAIAPLAAFLKSGGQGLLAIRGPESVAALAAILGVKAAAPVEASISGHARFGEIDFKSSVFAPFADARYSDFSGIRIWKYRVLPKDLVSRGTILAGFDTGDPAWIGFPVGKGMLHVLTTTWRPVDSQLALTTKFPPLLHSLLSRAFTGTGTSGPFLVGAPVPLPAGVSGITRPDGSKVNVKPGEPFTATDIPGIYQGENTTFAVRIDPPESEITPLPVGELRALGLPLDELKGAVQAAESATRISNLEAERRQRVGWWLVIAAALFFLAETSWSAIAGRQPTLVRP